VSLMASLSPCSCVECYLVTRTYVKNHGHSRGLLARTWVVVQMCADIPISFIQSLGHTLMQEAFRLKLQLEFVLLIIYVINCDNVKLMYVLRVFKFLLSLYFDVCQLFYANACFIKGLCLADQRNCNQKATFPRCDHL